jgi:hypothetical protein
LLDTGVGTLEIEPIRDFLVGLIDGIFDFDDVGFGYSVKRWHGLLPSASGGWQT